MFGATGAMRHGNARISRHRRQWESRRLLHRLGPREAESHSLRQPFVPPKTRQIQSIFRVLTECSVGSATRLTATESSNSCSSSPLLEAQSSNPTHMSSAHSAQLQLFATAAHWNLMSRS